MLKTASLMFSRQCHHVVYKRFKERGQEQAQVVVATTLSSGAAAVLHVCMYLANSFSAISFLNSPLRCSLQAIIRMINNTTNIKYFYMIKPMKPIGGYLEDS